MKISEFIVCLQQLRDVVGSDVEVAIRSIGTDAEYECAVAEITNATQAKTLAPRWISLKENNTEKIIVIW